MRQQVFQASVGFKLTILEHQDAIGEAQQAKLTARLFSG